MHMHSSLSIVLFLCVCFDQFSYLLLHTLWLAEFTKFVYGSLLCIFAIILKRQFNCWPDQLTDNSSVRLELLALGAGSWRGCIWLCVVSLSYAI